MVRRFVISGAAFCGLTLAGLMWSTPAAASSITVSVGRTLNGGCLLGQASGTTPQSISQSCVFNNEHPSSAVALGDYGSLGVGIDLTYTSGSVALFHSAVASASFIADGYVLSGPAGTIATSLNLSLSGFMTSSCAVRECIESAHLNVVTGTTGSSGELFVRNGQIVGASGAFALAGLVGVGGAFPLTTPLFNVTVGVPFSVAIDLSVSGEFLGPGSGRISDDLSHTLTYFVGGPVFNLPAGYTINGLNVTNNVYGVPTPTPVPEPAAIGLIGTLLALGAGRLKRRG